MVNNTKTSVRNDLTYGRGYVYSLQYHIIWCTKYRKPVLKDKIRDDTINYLNWVSKRYFFTIDTMEVMPDHIHLLIDCSPQFCIPDMMRIIKGGIARKLFLNYPELKSSLWGGHLWNPSYCIVTVSDRSIDQIRHYINTQKSK